MLFASALLNRIAPIAAIARRDPSKLYVLVFLHVSALAIMAATEVELIAKAAFLLAWGMLNFIGFALTRRPIVAAIIALEFILGLVLLSQFKHDKLWMTVDFVDLMIIDQDTSSFLLTAIPSVRLPIFVGLFGTVFLLTTAWRFDPFRLHLRTALAGGVLCVGALVFLSLSFPTNLYEDFFSRNYVSKFARTGVEAVHEFISHGYLESDSNVVERLKAPPPGPCNAPRKLPHIILLHDESSFDITIAPGMKVPPGYHRHFQSFDRKTRKLVVEGAGGPSWFTEYNVLTGLSARSYGRFATSVTRIAGGRVVRGLPRSLTRCGYKSFSLYPFYGAFLGSRGFQTSTGIERYLDMQDLGTRGFETDSFYFDQATKIIAREGESRPLFLYIYNVANHFPWDTRLRPELTPNWHDLGNAPNVDEYIRRQEMTAVDYRVLLGRLAREFPNESFLVVRYGDHHPEFARHLIDPSLSGEELARHLEASDLRYFTTYYAIDTVNFTPSDLSSALDKLDAPYLPLVVQEAAGVPLGPTFSEQKKILERCHGVFYNCAGGTEVRRFNRLLIEAGLIRGL